MKNERAQGEPTGVARISSGVAGKSAQSGLAGGALPTQARSPFLLQATIGNRAFAGLVRRWRDESGDAVSPPGLVNRYGSRDQVQRSHKVASIKNDTLPKAVIQRVQTFTIAGKQYIEKRLLRPDAKERPYLVEGADARLFVVKAFDPDRAQVYKDERQRMTEVQGSVNVVSLVAYDDEQRLLLMEYVEHGSVAEIFKRPDKVTEVMGTEAGRRSLVSGILEGVRHVHSKGIRHGEVDDKNIFVGSGATAKIADFGESKRLEGTPETIEREKIREVMSSLTPIVRIVTGGAISRGSELPKKTREDAKFSGENWDEAWAFLQKVASFFTLWENEQAYLGSYDPAPFEAKIEEIRNHRWLTL